MDAGYRILITKKEESEKERKTLKCDVKDYKKETGKDMTKTEKAKCEGLRILNDLGTKAKVAGVKDTIETAASALD